MPLRVYSDFLGRLTLESREYAVLKTAIIKPDPAIDCTIVIICDEYDGRLLLTRATDSYPEALPFVQLGLDGCG